MVKVSISLVDGSLQEYSEGDNFVSRLKLLQSQGYQGKTLVHELISDDWGPPPRFVHIKGTTSEGSKVDVQIPYE